jgi:hypothetical protein
MNSKRSSSDQFAEVKREISPLNLPSCKTIHSLGVLAPNGKRTAVGHRARHSEGMPRERYGCPITRDHCQETARVAHRPGVCLRGDQNGASRAKMAGARQLRSGQALDVVQFDVVGARTANIKGCAQRHIAALGAVGILSSLLG